MEYPFWMTMSFVVRIFAIFARTPNQTMRIKLEADQADHNDSAICRASIEPFCGVRV